MCVHSEIQNSGIEKVSITQHLLLLMSDSNDVSPCLFLTDVDVRVKRVIVASVIGGYSELLHPKFLNEI